MGNNLEDLVLGALQEPAEESLDPLDILEGARTLQPGVLSEKLKEGALEIEADSSKSWEVCTRALAWIIKSEGPRAFYSGVSELARTNKSFPFLLRAQMAASNPEEAAAICEHLRKLSDSLLEEEKAAQQRAVVGNFSSSIQFLNDYWGEDAAEKLSALTNSRKATVRRWLKGGSAQWQSTNKVRSVAKAFYALEQQGKSREYIISWWDKPLASGESPAELWSQQGYGLPKELEEELNRQGATN